MKFCEQNLCWKKSQILFHQWCMLLVYMFLSATEKMESKAALIRLLVNSYFPIWVSRGRWEVLLILSFPQGMEAVVSSPHIVSAGVSSSVKVSSLTLCQCGVTPVTDSPPKWVLPMASSESHFHGVRFFRKRLLNCVLPCRIKVLSKGCSSWSVSQGHSLLQAPSIAAQVFSPS